MAAFTAQRPVCILPTVPENMSLVLAKSQQPAKVSPRAKHDHAPTLCRHRSGPSKPNFERLLLLSGKTQEEVAQKLGLDDTAMHNLVVRSTVAMQERWRRREGKKERGWRRERTGEGIRQRNDCPPRFPMLFLLLRLVIPPPYAAPYAAGVAAPVRHAGMLRNAVAPRRRG